MGRQKNKASIGNEDEVLKRLIHIVSSLGIEISKELKKLNAIK